MKEISAIFLTEGPKSPSTRFAVTALLPLLRDSGVRCTVAHRRPEKYALPHLPVFDYRFLRLPLYCLLLYPYSLLARARDLCRAGRYDIVFLQRDLDENHTSAWLERLFRRRSKRLVFYFDDALWAGRNHQGRSLESKIREIIKMADCVVVSHAYLADYARRFNPAVLIFPLAIDTRRFAPACRDKENERVTIGWTGGPWNHHELLELTGLLGEIREETGAEILIQSGAPPPPALQRVGVQYLPWHEEREVEGLQRMDIAICPLKDTPWTRGKFSIKLLQYQAVGLPVVCSDVGANREIIADGRTGYVVQSREEWRSRLLALIRQRDLRERMGRAARERALELYPLEKAGARLADLFFSLTRGTPAGVPASETRNVQADEKV
jgi:glycosyltransferase involved in cell wall biosynthesis